MQVLEGTRDRSGQAMLFEMAVQQIEWRVLAGSLQSQQLQSGAGPIAMEASITAFNVTHAFSDTAEPSASGAGPSAAAYDSDDLELAHPWLLKSPSGPYCLPGKVAAPPFLMFTWKQPVGSH